MKLPRKKLGLRAGVGLSEAEWSELCTRADGVAGGAGRGDAFQEAVDRLREFVRSPDPAALRELLGTRVGGRALTWLWLEDQEVGEVLMRPKVLDSLVEAQSSRVRRMTLLQLLQLYFDRFDELDEVNNACRKGMRECLERHLRAQLVLLPAKGKNPGSLDPLNSLKEHGERLLAPDGPTKLAERVREEGGELGQAFADFGLSGLDSGRYADICRAHFYLQTLRELEVGQHDPVFDELLKPSVSHAPYESERRIGHVALEILIDRAGDAPPEEPWQAFILDLAGDPRIASSSSNFRDWWHPLGDVRVERVRSWLSREDLRLFLRAVEEYGKDSCNDELQRMFPARKVFLEGLYDQGLIRGSRLMLGMDAESTVRRLLGKELATSFVRLENMADKAVIYLDCGDFHIIEGSHSFKIWTYLERPSSSVSSYDIGNLSHWDLTKRIPQEYEKSHPGLPHSSVVHVARSFWQRRVFEFLAENGIQLDIEQMLTPSDYKRYLDQHGLPVVSSRRSRPARKPGGRRAGPVTARSKTRKRSRQVSVDEDELEDLMIALGKLGPRPKRILLHLQRHPGDKAKYIGNVLDLPPKVVNQHLHGDLSRFCTQADSHTWSLTDAAALALRRLYE